MNSVPFLENIYLSEKISPKLSISTFWKVISNYYIFFPSLIFSDIKWRHGTYLFLIKWNPVNGIYKDVHILNKSNTFLLHVKPHFYFDRLQWSFCLYTLYDANFLKLNGKILMKWLSQPASSCVHVVPRPKITASSRVLQYFCCKQKRVSALHRYKG